ncbi:MAG: entericidin [Prevotella sp.]|nr:entericidin [Prevotella sp.]
MKKLVFMFVAFAAISFASCDGTQKPAGNTDSLQADTAAVVDSAAADTAAAPADTAAADTAQAK